MSETGLGAALRKLRDRRALTVREVGKLSDVDHAYVHRLETGVKSKPSSELVDKLMKTLKANERDSEIVKWLAEHPETNAQLVEFVLDDPSIEVDVFTVAAGARHRGIGRPEPSILIDRVRRALHATEAD